MSDTLIESILRADKVFIPYELQDNKKQASNIVLMRSGHYTSYEFKDHSDEYLGPVSIVESKLSSNQIQSGLKMVSMEAAKVAHVNVLHSGVLLNGEYEPVIEGIDLQEESGKILQMRREGATYAYGLVLEISQVSKKQNQSIAR